MGFTLDTWRAQTKDRLKRWKARFVAPVAGSIYGTVAATALWPVVVASQGGDLIAASVVLGSVIGGVGSNLIADELKKWAKNAENPEDVAGAIAEKSAVNPDFRQEIDAVLEKLDALTLAREALAESDRQWFAETLRRELQHLGNFERFSAVLSGGGAIAQGEGAKAVGKKGVLVEGDVSGSVIITGDHNRLHLAAAEGNAAAALQISYLNWLFWQCRKLSLSGIDPKAAGENSEDLKLDAVYTALKTMTPDEYQQMRRGIKAEMETRYLSALEQLNKHPYLVLLGDPGSGKTTFVNVVALCLAGEALGQPETNLDLLTSPLPAEDEKTGKPQPWDHGTLLPIRVILRDFAARGLAAAGSEIHAGVLWDFIAAELKRAGLEKFTSHLQQVLGERGGLLLLDGLDEVPEAEQRRVQIKQAVEDFKSIYPKCRILATSRTYAYQKQNWKLNGFQEAVLATFSKSQINHFVDHWYTHVGKLRGWHPDKYNGAALLLKNAVLASDRLRELAERPLLLTLMASLHVWRSGTLPENREELYADAVDLLLELWEQPKVVRDAQGEIQVGQPSLAEWLKVDRQKVRSLLNRLAYQAHKDQPELHQTADIPESELVESLMKLSKNPDVRPKRLLEFLSDRAGLLLPRGEGVYTFPHRTFQEYLAACYLTDHDFPDKIAELACRDVNRWREVALLAAAKAARGAATTIWLFIDTLCFNEAALKDLTMEDLWGAQLAGQALTEMSDRLNITRHYRPKFDKVRQRLAEILIRPEFPAIERVAAGRRLAVLGDCREAVLDVDQMLFCYVPGGPFYLGEGNNAFIKDTLTDSYWMSQYLVTNAQFAAFVAAGGYQNPHYWEEAKAAGEWKAGAFQERRAPKAYGAPFDLPNHPVVGVTWYEALAFTRWLTEKWRKEGLLSENEIIRLPSESEWEKAARGGLEIPRSPLILTAAEIDAAKAPAVEKNRAPQRIFPWGDGADPERVNFSETNINATSAVGCFSGGASPYGCEEMSGNVWEWCQTKWRDRYDHDEDNRIDASGADRVDRGGSWADGAQYCRVSYRVHISPVSRGYDLGFRLLRAAL